MPQIGPLEIVVVLLVALLVFGPRRLPEVGKQAARGLRELREFQANVRSDLQGMLDSDDDRDDDNSDDNDAGDEDDFVPPDPPEDAPALEAGTASGAAPTAETAPSDDTRPPGHTPPATASS